MQGSKPADNGVDPPAWIPALVEVCATRVASVRFGGELGSAIIEPKLDADAVELLAEVDRAERPGYGRCVVAGAAT